MTVTAPKHFEKGGHSWTITPVVMDTARYETWLGSNRAYFVKESSSHICSESSCKHSVAFRIEVGLEKSTRKSTHERDNRFSELRRVWLTARSLDPSNASYWNYFQCGYESISSTKQLLHMWVCSVRLQVACHTWRYTLKTKIVVWANYLVINIQLHD